MPTVKQLILKQSPAKPVTFSRQHTSQRKGDPEWKFKIKDFKQIREYVDSETLAVCDLDNTVHQIHNLQLY